MDALFLTLQDASIYLPGGGGGGRNLMVAANGKRMKPARTKPRTFLIRRIDILIRMKSDLSPAIREH